MQAAVRAGCNTQVAMLLMTVRRLHSDARWTACLIDAILHFNEVSVELLLEAGASANAVDPKQPAIPRSGWRRRATSRMPWSSWWPAGADVNQRAESRHAANRDAADPGPEARCGRSRGLLLEAGALLHNKDLNGWTVMHIAAFEGATESMAVLVEAGGDVNQSAQGLPAADRFSHRAAVCAAGHDRSHAGGAAPTPPSPMTRAKTPAAGPGSFSARRPYRRWCVVRERWSGGPEAAARSCAVA